MNKLKNAGLPHVCYTIQAHDSGPNGVYLCSKCNMVVDAPKEEKCRCEILANGDIHVHMKSCPKLLVKDK